MRWLPSDVDRLLLVFSDVEMGAGGVLDDFPHSDWLAELLADYATGPAAGGRGIKMCTTPSPENISE